MKLVFSDHLYGPFNCGLYREVVSLYSVKGHGYSHSGTCTSGLYKEVVLI